MTVTYSSLQATIADTLQRTDLTTEIQEWIASAEQLVAREVRPRGFETFVQSTFTPGSAGAIIDAPTGIITMGSFVVLHNDDETATGNIRSDLMRRTYSFVRDYARDQTVTGLPRFYADMGQDNFIVAKAPVAAFGFEMFYYAQLTPLSSGNTTNWLTQYAPDLLLYASLILSAPFLRDDDRIPTWQGLYTKYAAALTATENVFKTSDATTPKTSAEAA